MAKVISVFFLVFLSLECTAGNGPPTETRSLNADANIPSSEMQALLDLYESTSGDEWRWLSSYPGVPWNFSATANPCTEKWQGLNCSIEAPYDYYHITELELRLHALRGTIPPSISLLSQLQIFDLSRNRLTGKVPESLGNLSNLVYFGVDRNVLSGPAPSCYSCSLLEELYLGYNEFSGSFRSAWLNLTNLNTIDITRNYLSGPLPADIDRMTGLIYLYFTENFLSSTIPDAFGSLGLIDFFMSKNLFTGTVSDALSSMTSVHTFTIGWNALTGTLPSFANMLNMESLGVYGNYFHGTIAPSLGNLPVLSSLQNQDNYFTGSIPESFGNLQYLYLWYAESNFLTGTIPASLGRLPILQSLYLPYNLLTGTVPSFKDAPQLYLLALFVNEFSGPFDDKLDPTVQPDLYYVDIGNNQFTGTLPETLFQAQSLQVFVADVNCFHGSIPESICAAKRLSALVLDGLSSARACRTLNIAGTYSINGAIQGGVPSCLFQMPNITSLHLSGNGLTGSLPPDLIVSSSMYDLTLSHNQLTGSIPRRIQQRKWYTLDMSYNRLSGTLDADFGTQDFNFSYFVEVGNAGRAVEVQLLNTTERLFNVSAAKERIILEVLLTDNRLSGKIPQSIRELKDVSVLGTNMFSCKLDGSDLPAADNGSGNYQCGSSAFDVPYYVWLVMSGTLCAVAVGALYKPLWTQGIPGAAGAVATVRKWLSFDPAVASGTGLRVFMHLLDRMCLAAGLLMGYILIVLLPLYCTMSAFYGEYTYEYAWSTSAAFMSGATPTGLEFTAWLVLLALVLYGGIRSIQALHAQATYALSGKRASRVISLALERLPLNRSILIYIAYALVNLVVVIGVNIAYVYVAIYRSSSLQIFAQIMLSLFKMGWSSVCTSKTLRLSVQSVTNGRITTASTFSDTDYASLQVFVVLLNSIIVPCCVVAAISPNCFYNAFVPAPEVRSEFFYQQCAVLGTDNSCYRYIPTSGTIHYDPPFIYAFQCSSSLITYYAPAFVNLCILNAFFSPAAQYINLVLYRCAAPGTAWFRVLDYFLPRVLHPLTAGSANSPRMRSVYNVHRLVNALMMYSGLLLTFGVVFPPLAVALVATLICVAYYAKATIGRFVCNAAEGQLPHCVEMLEADCQSVGSVPLLLHNSLWMIVTIACWFYTLFLFDTLGDAVGFEGAYWVLIVVPLLPGVMYIVTAMVEKYTAAVISEIECAQGSPKGGDASPARNTGGEEGIELHAVARNPMTA